MLKRVMPPEAAALVADGWTYLDVRSVSEFEQGHPHGAVNIPLLDVQAGRMVPNPDFLAVVKARFPVDANLVIGCKSGGRSAQAAAMFAGQGYASLVDVRGGFSGERDALGRVVVAGWAEAGFPVDTVASVENTYAALASKRT